MGLTAEQETLRDAIQRVLEASIDIQAAWLAGSLGYGGGDAFSDVDVLALAPTGRAAEASDAFSRDLAAVADPALVNRLFGGRVVSVVTTDWGRYDVSFVEPDDLARYDAARLIALFNKGDQVPPTKTAEPYRTSPDTLRPLVDEFLRVLGLLVVAAGREEWLLGLSGIDILRRLTIDLMLEENGIGPVERGGALHRNPLLTAPQRAELEGLAPVAPNRASLIAANLALAAIFLPRARRLADEIGMAWPDVFEAATRRHLERRLGLVIASAT